MFLTIDSFIPNTCRLFDIHNFTRYILGKQIPRQETKDGEVPCKESNITVSSSMLA